MGQALLVACLDRSFASPRRSGDGLAVKFPGVDAMSGMFWMAGATDVLKILEVAPEFIS